MIFLTHAFHRGEIDSESCSGDFAIHDRRSFTGSHLMTSHSGLGCPLEAYTLESEMDEYQPYLSTENYQEHQAEGHESYPESGEESP